jgi:hypothetical protein
VAPDTPSPRRLPGAPWALVAGLAVAGAGLLAWRRPWRDPEPTLPAAPEPVQDAFHPDLPALHARGEPIAVRRRLAAGDELVATGKMTYRQTPEYVRLPAGEKRQPRRSISGTFTAKRTIEYAARGDLRDVVVVDLDLVDETGEEAPKTRKERVTFRFDERVAGRDVPLVPKEEGIPADLDGGPFEALEQAFTEPVPVPDRPVRVEEEIPILEAADLDSIQRPLVFAFAKTGLPLPKDPVKGRAWVEGRGADDTLVVRLVLLHAHETELTPGKPAGGKMAYAIAWNDRRSVAVDGGHVTSCRLRHDHLLRAQAPEVDFRIAFEQTVSMDVSRAKKD